MNSTSSQTTLELREFQELVSQLQSLREYLGLLKATLSRYKYLKKSGLSDAGLDKEKGLIDRQLLILSGVCEKLK
jgi:hypothetical protein